MFFIKFIVCVAWVCGVSGTAGVSLLTDKWVEQHVVRVSLLVSGATATDSGQYSCLPGPPLPASSLTVTVLPQQEDNTSHISATRHKSC